MDANTLTEAIVRRLGTDEETAREISLLVLEYFGYGDVALDNMLCPEDRQVFWDLEEAGILKMDIEEVTICDGRGWRVCEWRFNRIGDIS